MKRKVTLPFILALLGVGIFHSEVADASRANLQSEEQVVQLESLPEEVMEQISLGGYNLEDMDITYQEVKGEELFSKVRAMQATVVSAHYTNLWSGAKWNIRYRTLNVRNGYRLSGWYSVPVSPGIVDRIYTYQTW